MIWFGFALCALIIAAAGPILARSAGNIAESVGLSHNWVGIILLATATSLPELVTGLSAVTVANAPNIAVGDALGSCIFNLALLALLDFLSGPDPFFDRADRGHILTAALGILMTGVVGMVLIAGRGTLDLRLWHVSIYSPLLALLYVIAVRATFRHERRMVSTTEARASTGSVRGEAVRYAAAALLIVAAGSALPFIGLGIAGEMGWHTSFVGTLLIATATSLPELVVTIAALRLGSVDMAMAGILGSNLFNMLVLAIDDAAYSQGALLALASPAHAASAFAILVMSGIVIIAIVDRPSARLFGPVGWISIALSALYLASAYAIFLVDA